MDTDVPVICQDIDNILEALSASTSFGHYGPIRDDMIYDADHPVDRTEKGFPDDGRF
jgi:hypothetical protein